MTTTGNTSPKIDRILRATRDLTLRGGIRGITIAEIAREAGVGKGTLYLYWSTKEDLLADLFAHDLLAALGEVEDGVRRQPDLIQPHCLLPLVGRTLDEHPFAAAVHANSTGLLGTIITHPAIGSVVHSIGPVAMLAQAFPVLRRHGVIRTDLAVETQVHATAALLHGLHDVAEREPVADLLPGSASEKVLADACVALLEPEEPGDVAGAAAEALEALASARATAITDLKAHGLGRTGAV